MIEESNNHSEKPFLGGLSNGETIIIADVKKSAEVFALLFHELGHNIDSQFDLKKILKPISKINSETIVFSDEEAQWLIDESRNNWETTGISDHHRSIIRKILKLILAEGEEVRSDIRSVSTKEFNSMLSTVSVSGSEQDAQTGAFKIVNNKLHRNLEVPADFVMELMIDVFNRSINKHFSLPKDVRLMTVSPDERNGKSLTISRYLIKRKWLPPGHLFRVFQGKPD